MPETDFNNSCMFLVSCTSQPLTFIETIHFLWIGALRLTGVTRISERHETRSEIGRGV